MCRLLGYLGNPIQLDQLLTQAEHSLIAQSYQPLEMTAGLLNADGFGIGWYDLEKATKPYIYKNTVPIWNDINLPHIGRYVESGCWLGYVRSATPPLAIDLTNCQPFTHGQILFIHNGFINHFRKTLYRPIRNLLNDESYQFIHGTTDSEHIFALIINELGNNPQLSLAMALEKTLHTLIDLAIQKHTYFSANIILSDGQQLVACRYANREPIPTLYWLAGDERYPDGIIIASEPLFTGDWQAIAPKSLVQISATQGIQYSSV